MGWFFNPPPPQPAAVHTPPNAAAVSNIPPNPVGPGSPLIRSLWPEESWPSQILIGGGVGALTASPFVPPVAIAAANPAILAAIRTAWPPEQWAAQGPADSASLFASVANPPVAYPSRPAALTSVRAHWAPESWYAQSESGIASGLAQIQLPPVYQPWSTVQRMMLLRSLWLAEEWRAQTGVRGAGWIPQQQPVTPLPTVIRHLEIGLWTPDTWAAQSGMRNAVLGAGIVPSLPYFNRWLSAALRTSWPAEDWPAQTYPDFAGGQSPLPPPLPQAPSQFPISQWAPEFWGPQTGTRDASILAPVQILVLMPFVIGLLRDVAIAELESLFAATISLQYVHSGAAVLTVVEQSIPKGTPVFPAEAVTLKISLGRQVGPTPCPVVESIIPSNIQVVLPLSACNVKVLH